MVRIFPEALVNDDKYNNNNNDNDDNNDYNLIIRPKKKLIVSCNPTLTNFYSKKSLP